MKQHEVFHGSPFQQQLWLRAGPGEAATAPLIPPGLLLLLRERTWGGSSVPEPQKSCIMSISLVVQGQRSSLSL